MAKGNQVIPLRMTPDMLAAMDAYIAARNERSSGVPYDRSSFIRAAIQDKLDHAARSRRSRRQPPSQHEGDSDAT